MTSEIRVNSLTNRSGISTVSITDTGVVVAGILTAASGTFSGNVSIGGTLTYEDVTYVDAVGIITAQAGIDAVGVITARSGVVIGGDANNGVAEGFKLDANGLMQVSRGGGVSALFAGYTQGSSTQTSRINNNGNAYFLGDVGIGTNNPFNATGYKSITLAGSTGGAIAFREGATTRWEVYGDNSNGIRFYDRTNTAERLRIDSSGRLLLGTTTEGEANADDLTVATSGHTGMTIRSGTANRGNIYFSDGTSGDTEYRGYITYDHDGDKFKFGTVNADRLLINSSGKVGINESSPLQQLHVSSTASTYIQVQNTGDSVNAYYGVDTASAWAGSSTNHPFKLHTNNTERLRITSAGSVGIGTDNPQSLLSLHQSGGGFEVNANSGSNNARLLSYDRSADVYREMTLQALSYGIETSGTERLRVTSNGRLVIGHNAEVAGAYDNSVQTKQVQIINGANSGDQGLGIYSYSSAGWAPRLELAASRSGSKGGHTVVTDGQSCGVIVFNGSDGTNFSTAAALGANVDGTPANDSIPGSLSFYTSPGSGLSERLSISSNGDMRLGASSYGDPKTKLDIIEDQTIPFSVNANTGTFVGVMVRTRYYLEFSVEFPQHATNTSIQLRFNRTSNAPSISIDYYSGGGYQVDHGVTGVAYISFYAASGNTLYTGTNHQSAYGGATPSWSHSGGTSEVLFKLSNIAYSNGSMCHFRINMPRGGVNSVTVDRTTP